MGYWDRPGFPSFYKGPTTGGVAPLNSYGVNKGIRSMWATRAGFDGRPDNQPGHDDDYYIDYESLAPDPYVTAKRKPHPDDCLGDFIGLSQNLWKDLGGECSGNLDGFSYQYWDKSGDRSYNFVPPPEGDRPVKDVLSGIQAWTVFRGEQSVAYSQLVDTNPETPEGKGFTFKDIQHEIDQGYPVLLVLQNPFNPYRDFPGVPRTNPELHGMVAYGYYLADSGLAWVRFRDSWAGGDSQFCQWSDAEWVAGLRLRGVIGYRPLPRISSITRQGDSLNLVWTGPTSILHNVISGDKKSIHHYTVERAWDSASGPYEAVSTTSTEQTAKILLPAGRTAFLRIRLEYAP